jgi:hypothetical protein
MYTKQRGKMTCHDAIVRKQCDWQIFFAHIPIATETPTARCACAVFKHFWRCIDWSVLDFCSTDRKRHRNRQLEPRSTHGTFDGKINGFLQGNVRF